MRLSLSSNSTRTLVVLPAAVLAEQAVSRRRLRPRWLPVMLAGFLQYKLAGDYRIRVVKVNGADSAQHRPAPGDEGRRVRACGRAARPRQAQASGGGENAESAAAHALLLQC